MIFPPLRSELIMSPQTRIRAIREYAARMRGRVLELGEGDDQESEKCRKALEWAWRELGLL